MLAVDFKHYAEYEIRFTPLLIISTMFLIR